MVFVDADEYLVVPSGRKLQEVLEPYSEFGGVAVNWRYGQQAHRQPHIISYRPTGQQEL